MLAAYELLTQSLLQAPSSTIPLIPTATLDLLVNQARVQVAAQAECIRVYGSLSLVAGQLQYPFSTISLTSVAGVAAPFNVRQLWYQIGGGQLWVTPRQFEYFGIYVLNNAAPVQGSPQRWAQFGQGTTGSIFIDPVPDQPYTCPVDVVAEPIPLVDDTTVEAIPQIWTLAVPFYSAWLGFLTLQRAADADAMFKRFQEQMGLARGAANPSLLSETWAQAPDKMEQNRLGLQAAAGGR